MWLKWAWKGQKSQITQGPVGHGRDSDSVLTSRKIEEDYLFIHSFICSFIFSFIR